MSRKRLLNLLVPPKVQTQILFERLNNELYYARLRNRPGFDYHRATFFDPHGGMAYLRYCYTQGEATAQRVRECIKYHRSLRESFTTRLP